MNGPLKWHGGKHYLAQKIVSLMPEHTHYVEPYAGGLAVLLAKPCQGSEVVNDLNQDLTVFWRVLQDEELFTGFQRKVEAIPFSQVEWRDAKRQQECTKEDTGLLEPLALVELAVRFFVICRQSLAGRCQDFAPLTRNRTRSGMNEQASAWLNAVNGLPAVHNRLKRVVVLNRPALEVMRSQDGPEALFYLDPPYLPETRSDPNTWGTLDMSEADHGELLDTIQELQGRVMISGYRCSLYDSELVGWTRHEFELPNNAARGKAKRRMIEALWCNFNVASKEVA